MKGLTIRTSVHTLCADMSRLSIAMFVDACGWGVLESRPWFLEELTTRRKVESLFGYSSACVPAILSGNRPDQNDHWSAFYYSPKTSPFRRLRHLRYLPRSIFERGRVRAMLSKLVAKQYGFTGYFQIYNVPFEVLPEFDYAEKKDIFRPGGMNRGRNIFDALEERKVPYHVSNWRLSEQENIAGLRGEIQKGKIRFAFLYSAALDSLMHDVTKSAAQVDDKLRWYQSQVRDLLALASLRYDEVHFSLFSDHGMCTVQKVVDWIPKVEATGLAFGKDYSAVYDSTMMRFWFLRPGAEEKIRAALVDNDDAHWITEEQHKAFGTYWKDGRFGDAVYALEPGVLLNPCHMGNVPLKGMHGYRPDHEDSYSAMLANFEPQTETENIVDYYDLMSEMADWAVESTAE